MSEVSFFLFFKPVKKPVDAEQDKTIFLYHQQHLQYLLKINDLANHLFF